MVTSTPHSLPPSWHTSPSDAFHGRITPEGPFHPTKNRYHLYIGLFCPFAHRANYLLHLKQLHDHAGIETSIVKPYPKGDDKGWPGWQFNVRGEGEWYDGSTEDRLFGCKYLHEIYFKADPHYKGRYSVPVLWDTHLNTIVNNESLELLRDLQTAFNTILPRPLADITLYPADLKDQIDQVGEWLQRDLNTGVYKTGFAPDQASYNRALPAVFAALNRLENLVYTHGGPYVLGKRETELDIRAYATLIRFDTVYVTHFKCNLGTVRHNYPVLNNWMKFLYWTRTEYRDTTVFRHIKDNYFKSHYDINPRGITPLGPWPPIEEGVEHDYSKLVPGQIQMPEVKEAEERLDGERFDTSAGFSLDHFKE